ncbi:MAG: 30S ribosomal protein S20 [Elusimicrobia bacterium]|nr:30S ribosomal protein S20 [Elusimicrobiota bacterium]
MAKLKTGRHTSALKEVRKTKTRTARNSAQKSKIRTLAKKLEAAIKAADAALAQNLLKGVFSAWDKAAKKNVIHKKAASNKKAKLAKKVSSLSAKK